MKLNPFALQGVRISSVALDARIDSRSNPDGLQIDPRSLPNRSHIMEPCICLCFRCPDRSQIDPRSIHAFLNCFCVDARRNDIVYLVFEVTGSMASIAPDNPASSECQQQQQELCLVHLISCWRLGLIRCHHQRCAVSYGANNNKLHLIKFCRSHPLAGPL